MAFRIVQVVQEFSTEGGVETVAWELQRAWDAARVPATVLASSARADIPHGARLRAVAPFLSRLPTRGRAGRYLGRLLVVPAFTLAATAALRRERDAAVLSHGDTLAGDVLVVHAVNKASLAEKRRSGSFGWRVNPMHLWVSARDRWMIGGLRFRYYVAVSGRVAQELRDFYGVPSDRIRVIPNGIDHDRFRAEPGAREAVRAELGIPEDAPVLLFAGHEFERKGLSYAIDAMAHLPPSVHLLVAGAGDAEPYRRRAAARDLLPQRRLHFVGSRRDMPRLYAAADAFVFPTAYESFSLVCMEAMGCGVPVFATRAGGIEEYLVDGVNGHGIARDSAAIAETLRPVLADRKRLATLREGALATARRYAWPEIAARYQALLHEAWLARCGRDQVTAATPATGALTPDIPAGSPGR